MGSSSTPPKEVSHMSTQYPDQFTPLIPIHFTNLMFFSQALHCRPPPHVPNSFVPASTYFGVLTSPKFYTPMLIQMSHQIPTHAMSPMMTLMQMLIQQLMSVSIFGSMCNSPFSMKSE
ncbi:hypothetical protein V6Z11_D05G338200 [Gossypium hirsutum]